MAGDWIKMRVDLADDPAVIGMADALGVDEYAIIGRLHKLWSWADKHCQNGHAKSVTFVWINRYVGHNGFAECMGQVGWLEATATGISFPHFDRHNGESAKKRVEATERKRLERILAAELALAAKNATAVTDMSQQLCDKSVTREEKRREEVNQSKTLAPGLPAEDPPATPIKIEKPPKPDCPHEEIIALYHECLPQCQQVRDWTPARQANLRARWNEDDRRQNLEYWRLLFQYVGTCDFLVGRSGKSTFMADLEWITKQSNFVKIREGKYENRA